MSEYLDKVPHAGVAPDVCYLLRGSVQRSRDRVRVVVHLIDARGRRAVGRGERERALVAAEAINMLALPWDPLLRAAVLGHLGQQEKARAALGELLALDPAFAGHARRYISGYVFQADLLAVIVDGLKRAGLKI